MIELKSDQLVFTFPEVHPDAKLTIQFQRTLRIPDDEQTYPLPPGLGKFPLRHVDDFAQSVPATWLKRGGVMLPMFQSEAMWLNFDSDYISEHGTAYPFAVKVATGKQCAVTGEAWQEGLRKDPQDYMVVPDQPWLDGFVVEKGLIRQFVAMPLGSGYSAEEQITGKAEHGGLQIAVYPMKRKVFERRFPKLTIVDRDSYLMEDACMASVCMSPSPDMGLAPGGKMRQEIYEDPYNFSDWNSDVSSRCFIHLCNSMIWQSITGSSPPHPAPTAKSYSKAGLPWFEYYADDKTAVKGSSVLSKLKSVLKTSQEKGEIVLPENETTAPQKVVVLREGLKKGQVREGQF